jgi:STE24 endopeptidase
MNEDRATRYQRLKRRATFALMLWGGACLAGLVGTGGAVALRDSTTRVVDSLAVGPSIGTWLIAGLFVGTVSAVHAVGAFPLSLYRGYLLERRFGLTSARPASWLRDHLVDVGLAVAAASATGGVVVTAGRLWPDWWWLPASAAVVAGLLALMVVYPLIAAPAFVAGRPIAREPLRARVAGLARRCGAPVFDVYEWPTGSRSREPNAALVGVHTTRRILLSDTLLRDYSEDEIEVIVAHELAHHVHGDLWKAAGVEGAVLSAGLFLADRVLVAAGPRLGLEGPADVAALPLVGLVVGILSMGARPIARGLSRRQERRADRFALEVSGNPEAFISATRRFAARHLADERPSAAVTLLCHTHPPVNERLEAARHWQAARSG